MTVYIDYCEAILEHKESLMEKYPDTAEKGIAGEKWLHEKMTAFYDEVKDHTDDAVYQTNGIDFSVKQETWKRAYTLDVKNNLKVGHKNNLQIYKKEIFIKKIHWLNKKYNLPLKAKGQIRYNQKDQNIEIFKYKIPFQNSISLRWLNVESQNLICCVSCIWLDWGY